MGKMTLKEAKQMYIGLLKEIEAEKNYWKDLNQACCTGSYGARMQYEQNKPAHIRRVANLEGRLTALKEMFNFSEKDIKQMERVASSQKIF